MECVKCVWPGRGRYGGETIGFGLYQSCRNRESVGRVSVLGLRWCWGGGVCGWLGPGWWCYVCECCEYGSFVEMAVPGICVLCVADTCTS